MKAISRIALYGGPGTGKTTAIVEHIDKLLLDGIDPSRIVVLSHTKTAAREIAIRCAHAGVIATTTHSFAFHLINGESKTVATDEVRNEFVAGLGLDAGLLSDSAKLFAEYDALVARGSDLRATSPLMQAWQRHKTRYGIQDFSDMLKDALTHPDCPEYDAVLIDEAQDLSKLQWSLIARICAPCQHALIAGDDDQAIYDWGGADAEGMARWVQKQSAEIAILRKSWRCPKAVFDIAQQFVKQLQVRQPKIIDNSGQLGKVVWLPGLRHMQYDKLVGPILWLCRTRREVIFIRRELIQQGLPVLYPSGKLYKQKELLNACAGDTKNDYARRLAQRYDYDYSACRSVAHKVCTVHSAKGTEAATVVYLNNTPMRVSNQDAEIRLAYVAITRSSECLYVVDGARPHVLI